MTRIDFRWAAIFLALTAGCASSIPFPPLTQPPADTRQWIGIDHPGDELWCVELFEPDGALKYACLQLKTIRVMANKIGSTD